MVIPSFDLMQVIGAVPCPTCNDDRRVFMTTSTIPVYSIEEICREKLYGEYA